MVSTQKTKNCLIFLSHRSVLLSFPPYCAVSLPLYFSVQLVRMSCVLCCLSTSLFLSAIGTYVMCIVLSLYLSISQCNWYVCHVYCAVSLPLYFSVQLVRMSCVLCCLSTSLFLSAIGTYVMCIVLSLYLSISQCNWYVCHVYCAVSLPLYFSVQLVRMSCVLCCLSTSLFLSAIGTCMSCVLCCLSTSLFLSAIGTYVMCLFQKSKTWGFCIFRAINCFFHIILNINFGGERYLAFY